MLALKRQNEARRMSTAVDWKWWISSTCLLYVWIFFLEKKRKERERRRKDRENRVVIMTVAISPRQDCCLQQDADMMLGT